MGKFPGEDGAAAGSGVREKKEMFEEDGMVFFDKLEDKIIKWTHGICDRIASQIFRSHNKSDHFLFMLDALFSDGILLVMSWKQRALFLRPWPTNANMFANVINQPLRCMSCVVTFFEHCWSFHEFLGAISCVCSGDLTASHMILIFVSQYVSHHLYDEIFHILLSVKERSCGETQLRRASIEELCGLSCGVGMHILASLAVFLNSHHFQVMSPEHMFIRTIVGSGTAWCSMYDMFFAFCCCGRQYGRLCGNDTKRSDRSRRACANGSRAAAEHFGSYSSSQINTHEHNSVFSFLQLIYFVNDSALELRSYEVRSWAAETCFLKRHWAQTHFSGCRPEPVDHFCVQDLGVIYEFQKRSFRTKEVAKPERRRDVSKCEIQFCRHGISGRTVDVWRRL